MVLDRLYHDDGVVDHDADRQHEGEERYGIGRETERQHRRESTDERDRHGDQRNEVARTLPRKRYTTMTTSAKASSRVLTTSWMLSSTKTVVS